MVSRTAPHHSTSHALATLRDEGLIISVTGKGYYVA
jgi:DNA-binding GntR family transcriptional regulator